MSDQASGPGGVPETPAPTTEPEVARVEACTDGPTDPVSSWHYPLDLLSAVTIERVGSGYICRPEHTFAAATPAWGLSQNDLAAARTLVHARSGVPRLPGPTPASPSQEVTEEGIAEAFVNLLRHEVIPKVEGFRVVRLVPPPEARGERPITEGRSSAVVVGERVVVTWVRTVDDAAHEAPTTLTHLDAVRHFEVPETHGMLLWTTPSGREVPVAWATKYLPRARDGWDWCIDLTQRALGVETDGGPVRPPSTNSPSTSPVDMWVNDFPARLGRTAAKLHLALATPSSVLPEPTATAPADLIRAWHSAAMERVEAAARIAREGLLEGVADVLLPRLPAVTAQVDRLAEVADQVADGTGPGVSIQRVHGDLHVGQVLRWPGGLVVVDFHPNPVVEVAGLSVGQAMAPAARDLARLLRSLDHVGRVVDKGTGFAITPAVDAWSAKARTQLLEAYRAQLDSAGRPELLDERLIAAFEAEQLCHEIVYAGQYLPSWVYAPLGGLWQSFEATPTQLERGALAAPVPGRRGRRAKPATT
ncbi:MAG: hypothetical protein JNL54_16570 [Kineosporiaceae bacterium]|nr:hypothetical protein [Kineosporiaceae bacterium]